MTRNTTHGLTQQLPGAACAEDGQVLLDGPDGVAITMTPHAAIITAHSLLAAAEEARNQRPEAQMPPIKA